MDKEINVDESLRDIENYLRNNIEYILRNAYGEKWEKYLGVSEERINTWKQRMQEERKRLKENSIENRIMYYSDFYDIKTIILKNWDLFKNCFSNKKIIEYQLTQLESFRNPNAHNRDLYEYQKHLLVGYIGEIKSGIMKYRGSIDNKSTFFPEYQSMNINGKKYNHYWANLKEVFRPGDQIRIVIYVSSPNTQKLSYNIVLSNKKNTGNWTDNNKFEVTVDDSVLGNNEIKIFYKSDSNYHLNKDWDGLVEINYVVVDNKE